jgi:hypothetical protein
MRLAATLLLLCAGIAHAATFTIINKDGVGEGLNDLAPFTPVGGNNATSLGQARLNVLVEAGRIWAAQLFSSQPIVVEASFDPLTCSANTGTLGSAGAHSFYSRNFPGGTYLVPAALENSLAGDTGGGTADIFARFNSDVRSGNTACLNGTSFYLGLDHAFGVGIDLLAVVLHEFGHGLGFVSLVGQNGNSLVSNSTQLSAYDQYVYSETLGRFWPAMTTAERATSLTDNGKLVFNSPSINGVLAQLTGGISNPGAHLRLYAPPTYSDGSSGSHWDLPAEWIVPGSNCSPSSSNVNRCSLLMEPFITRNPLGATDFTGCVLKDLGWLGTRCPDSTGVPPIAPLVAQTQTVTTNEDTPAGITILGTGGASSSLTYTITSSPAKGSLSTPVSQVSSGGILYTYAPNANVNGTDSFAFLVSDGTNFSTTATVTINITPVNDAPVANAQTVSTAAGVAVNITLAGSDVEGSPLTYAVVTSPAHGTLSGTAPALSYTPSAGFSGADNFSFRVNDGALNSGDAMVTINVSAPPAVVAVGDSGGGGGGSVDGLELSLLFLLLLGAGRVPPQCTGLKNARFWGVNGRRRPVSGL